MKYTLLWIAIFGVGIGVTVGVEAQQPRLLHDTGRMMGPKMMGGKMYASQATEEAASNYSNLCATCHGATGQGNGPAAMALHPKPKDFADCQTMAKIPDGTLFNAIHGGGQSVGLSPMMPPWSSTLTEQQIHDLVRYIRGFCEK